MQIRRYIKLPLSIKQNNDWIHLQRVPGKVNIYNLKHCQGLYELVKVTVLTVTTNLSLWGGGDIWSDSQGPLNLNFNPQVVVL